MGGGIVVAWIAIEKKLYLFLIYMGSETRLFHTNIERPENARQRVTLRFRIP